MKRLPYFAGLALVVVLTTVTILVRPTQAVDDPCYDSCSEAQDRINAMQTECYTQAAAQSPVSPNVTFNSNCEEANGGNNGGYSYSCSWNWFRTPPPPGISCYTYYGTACAGGGGFGGGNKIDPNDAACLY